MRILKCQSCGLELGKGGLKYVVEVKSFADFDGYLEEYSGDIEEGIEELLHAMENMDDESLEEDVYKENSYILCKGCRDKFIQDPFRKMEFAARVEDVKGTIH